MATVKLSQTEVIELFKAAPMHVINKIVSNGRIDVQAEYDALPDAIDVIRGVSTGINNFEDGFSWTRINEEAVRFAALNCQTKKDIPGFIRATIPKNAVLAMFSFEGEVVVDPTIKKLKIQTHFLRGPELRKFHANIDVEANTLDILFKTDDHNKRMNARPARSAKNDWELPVFLRTEPQAQLAD